jgi:hypothetical protein
MPVTKVSFSRSVPQVLPLVGCRVKTPTPGASDCQRIMLAFVASVPTFRRLRVLLDAPVMGSGDAGELLPPPSSCGRSWSPFLQKLFIVGIKSCLREVGSEGLRKLGPFSWGRQRVRLSNVPHLVRGVVLASIHLSCQVKARSSSVWADRWWQRWRRSLLRGFI